MKLFSKKMTKQAFTMAEAILVMTILGIIATIMITTLKPAQFKDKALKILYKKVMAEFDTATTQILVNNAKLNSMNYLYLDNSNDTFAFGSDWQKTKELYQKYLATTRKEYDSTKNLGVFSDAVTNSPTANSQTPPFYLKDGALIFLGTGEKYGVSKDITQGYITVDGCFLPKGILGIVTIDINGEEEPNTMYKDQFHFPIGMQGIEYDYMCQSLDYDYDLALEQYNNYDTYNGTTEPCESFGNGWVKIKNICNNGDLLLNNEGSCNHGGQSNCQCAHPSGLMMCFNDGDL